MTDLICELLLPAHGHFLFKSAGSNLKETDRIQAISAFGPLTYKSILPLQPSLTFDPAKNQWFDFTTTLQEVGSSKRHAKVLMARCEEVHAARRALSNLQAQVARTPRQFLSTTRSPMPQRDLDPKAWRRSYGSWLADANAEAERRTISESRPAWSRQERRLRATADILAALPRPAEVRVALLGETAEPLYRLQMLVPNSFRYPGIALRPNGGRIDIDDGQTVSASDHATMLSLSHVAALIAGLGNQEFDPETTLDIELMIGDADQRTHAGRMRTERGQWLNLVSEIARTPTDELENVPGLSFSLKDPIMLRE